MTRLIFIFLVFSLSLFQVTAQTGESNAPFLRGWQIGIGLGELPMGGSFKPSFTLGYHFNEHWYVGVNYQLKDKISRGTSSFNAKSTGLSQLQSSTESVGQRAILQVRYTPFRNGPYVAGGLVFNDTDSEQMVFGESLHHIGNNDYQTALEIQQTRKRGLVPALGIGYQYTHKSGLYANVEWIPGLFSGIPEPEYRFTSTETIASNDLNILEDKMTDKFQSTITNWYKVFHIGLGYQF